MMWVFRSKYTSKSTGEFFFFNGSKEANACASIKFHEHIRSIRDDGNEIRTGDEEMSALCDSTLLFFSL